MLLGYKVWRLLSVKQTWDLFMFHFMFGVQVLPGCNLTSDSVSGWQEWGGGGVEIHLCM